MLTYKICDMFKKLLILIFSLSVYSAVEAQNKTVSIGTTTTNDAVVLSVVSPNNNSGVLIPGLTSAQIAAIASPTHSLMVYNTDKGKFMYNAGTPATPLWTFVGDIPAVDNITSISAGVAGDVRYDKATGEVFYWKVGTGWTQLQSAVGP